MPDVISDEAFKKVADLIGDKNTPVARRSTKAEQLQLYGLYKRATADSSQRSATRPGILNIDGRLKWDAWVAVDKLSDEEARQAYVNLAKELIGTEIVETVLDAS